MVRRKPPNNNSIGIPAPIVPELGFCPVDNSSDVLLIKSHMSHEFIGASARAMEVSLVVVGGALDPTGALLVLSRRVPSVNGVRGRLCGGSFRA